MSVYEIASVVTLAPGIRDEAFSVFPATSSQDLVIAADHDYDPEAAHVVFTGTRQELEQVAARIAGGRMQSLLLTRHEHRHLPTPDKVRTTFIDPAGQPVATSTAAHNPHALEHYVTAMTRDIARLEERREAAIQLARLHDVSSARRLAGEAEVSHTTINAIQNAPLNPEALRAHVENTLHAAGLATEATNQVNFELHGIGAGPRQTAVTVSTPDWAHPNVAIGAGYKKDNVEILERAVAVLREAGLEVIETRHTDAYTEGERHPVHSYVIGQTAVAGS